MNSKRFVEILIAVADDASAVQSACDALVALAWRGSSRAARDAREVVADLMLSPTFAALGRALVIAIETSRLDGRLVHVALDVIMLPSELAFNAASEPVTMLPVHGPLASRVPTRATLGHIASRDERAANASAARAFTIAQRDAADLTAGPACDLPCKRVSYLDIRDGEVIGKIGPMTRKQDLAARAFGRPIASVGDAWEGANAGAIALAVASHDARDASRFPASPSRIDLTDGLVREQPDGRGLPAFQEAREDRELGARSAPTPGMFRLATHTATRWVVRRLPVQGPMRATSRALVLTGDASEPVWAALPERPSIACAVHTTSAIVRQDGKPALFDEYAFADEPDWAEMRKTAQASELGEAAVAAGFGWKQYNACVALQDADMPELAQAIMYAHLTRETAGIVRFVLGADVATGSLIRVVGKRDTLTDAQIDGAIACAAGILGRATYGLRVDPRRAALAIARRIAEAAPSVALAWDAAKRASVGALASRFLPEATEVMATRWTDKQVASFRHILGGALGQALRETPRPILPPSADTIRERNGYTARVTEAAEAATKRAADDTRNRLVFIAESRVIAERRPLRDAHHAPAEVATANPDARRTPAPFWKGSEPRADVWKFIEAMNKM